jgi:hypothetical protein
MARTPIWAVRLNDDDRQRLADLRYALRLSGASVIRLGLIRLSEEVKRGRMTEDHKAVQALR